MIVVIIGDACSSGELRHAARARAHRKAAARRGHLAS
jgi:hypothetical protein